MIEIFCLLVTVYFVFKMKNSFGSKESKEEKEEQEEVWREAMNEFFEERSKKEIEKLSNGNKDLVKTGKFGSKEITLINISKNISNSIFNDKENENYGLDLELNDGVKNILQEIGFNKDKFLNGAEKAVEMINEAFSNKDLNTLQEIISNDLFNSIHDKMEKLASENRELSTHLISILLKKITNIGIGSEKIFIDVFFDMEQINFVQDKNGEVVLGSKKQIDEVKEVWRFSRIIKSESNFWTVESINGNI